jgi:CxxC-x17-CxxC domain-containing protein
MPYIEKTLVACRDCGRSFPFTAEEQESFAQQGFRNEPSRCPECRAVRMARRNVAPGGSFGRSNYAGSTNQRSEPRVMHPAVCSRCGKTTEVPFQPRGDKPVFCSDCYRQEPRNDFRGGR